MRALPSFFAQLGLSCPLVQAPMAGGPATPELVAAVGGAGALGMLGAGYLTPQAIRAAAARVRERSPAPFGINLFVHDTPPRPDPLEMQRAVEALGPYHAELGLPAPVLPEQVEECLEEQLEAVFEVRPAVFSFAFGALGADVIERLHEAGMQVVGTATSVLEARALEDCGVDAVVVQGFEAGGHRCSFLHRFDEALVGTLALLEQAAGAVRVPLIAAGGIMNGRAVRAALDLGAAGAQLGTAFLLCDEAGTSAAYRAALAGASDTSTVLTRAFSGRPARGLRNRMTDELEGAALPYPYQNALTRALRAEAARQGRAEFLSLWAGQAAALARPLPAAELVRTLARELEETYTTDRTA
ncbi:nitronate monooxygenase [Deinobacterium chartae]|uniref:Propionate 3-nitronate monooxygenase n=1 Tax=Deinobacterium chartae TaxID=521158 RepID=A0A841I4X7_9DEIO|nr:nitronate monooxygenase [Deinobacterium chartae]MBB6099478.1 nitronate monooxygenase [Deinobacterium chartae]